MGVAEDLPPERTTVPAVLVFTDRQNTGKTKYAKQITIFRLLSQAVIWQCLRRNF